MMKKATRKDFYMEIRKSPGRFLSIFFIVALGVAFFSGIRASEPSMRVTGDAYFDGAKLMDIKAVCTYGITEDDILKISNVEGVESAEGAYSGDFLHTVADDQNVLHVMSLQEDMNQISVSEGRLPAKVGECLADNEMGYEVGDKIILESGTEDPISDTLKTAELEVVGLGSSPLYISYGRGNTTIGTGSVSGFLVVPQETFDMDVYTEVYLRAEGAEGLLAYTDAYEERIGEVLEQVETITAERSLVRRQELTDEANEELDKARTELLEGKAQAEQELEDAYAQISDAQSQLSSGKAEISSGKSQIADAKALLNEKQTQLDAARAEYDAGMAELLEGRAAYEQGLAEYEANRSQAEADIQSGYQQMSELRTQLDVQWQRYYALKEQIDAGVAGEMEQLEAAQLEAALAGQEQVYAQTTASLEAAQQELDAGAAALSQTQAQIEASEAQLADAALQIQSGQEQIDAGWAQIRQQEAALIQGEAEINTNEKKLSDALSEYEAGKEEANAEIADGEAEIARAEAEIADIEAPKWYVYDRSTLPEYDGMGENAQRVGAIGRVFPVIFFLVAALISLTSMTRMVEEQRTAIGTMKALGYGKFAIASKYLGYALLATVGGSIVGVLIGEKIIPYIVIYAYGILYHHISHILTPYDWTYGAMASGAAIACCMVATFTACYRELSAQPAVLMRPPSPKRGKRVFLERIKIIWKHLNFTWKSTIRNLMRYKKRFFMTIFGIGGCMALLLVGFGLRDSIYEIADLQYTQIQLYDGSIYLQEDLTDQDRQNLTEFLEQDSDVARFMNANMKSVTLTNEGTEREAYACVFGSAENIEQYVRFRDRRSKETHKLTDEGVIISEKTAKLLDVKAGDSIQIKDEENGNREVKIRSVCENYMGHYIYFTPGYYEKVYGKEPEYNSILFAVDDSYSTAELEQAGREILRQDEVLSVSYMHDIQKQLDDMLKSLNLVIVVLIISAGMLAFVVLYNLNNINITERQRELATLKVLGFYNLEVAEYVYRENIILTFVGAALGVGLGRVLHLFIIQTVEVDAAMFGRIINLPSYVYSLLFTLAFSMIVNGVMYFKLKRINMVESLKSIE